MRVRPARTQWRRKRLVSPVSSEQIDPASLTRSCCCRCVSFLHYRLSSCFFFSACTSAQSAVYPTLDRGVAASGGCLRKVAVPPVVVPTITGPPGSSASRRAGGGGQGSSGSFLPTLGMFPAGE